MFGIYHETTYCPELLPSIANYRGNATKTENNKNWNIFGMYHANTYRCELLELRSISDHIGIAT